MKESKSKLNLFALLQFGALPLLVLGIGFYTYFKSGDFLLTDFVVKEPYEHISKYPDCCWGSDLYVWFGDGRFGLYHEKGAYREYYSLYDRKNMHDLLLHVSRGEQRKNIIRLWDKDGREHILDFLALTFDGRCVECGKIHIGGMCPVALHGGGH